MTQLPMLWDYRVEREVLDFLRGLPSNLEPDQLAQVYEEIASGPPDLREGDDERVRLGEVLTIRRILAVEESSVDMPDVLREALAPLEERHPSCRKWEDPPDEPEVKFVGRPEPAALDLASQDAAEVAKLVASPPSLLDPVRVALDEYLSEIGDTAPDRFLEILRCSVDAKQESGTKGTTPEGVVDQYPLFVAQLFQAWLKGREGIDEGPILATWDKLLPIALASASGGLSEDSDDRLTYAINHPAGDLTQAILEYLLPNTIREGMGLPDELRPRLARILESTEPGAAAGRIVLASRLFALYLADSDWVRARFLSRMSWEHAEAAGLWQGYLWNSSINDPLFRDLRPSFLGVCDNWHRLGRHWEQWVSLLVSLAVDADGLLTIEDSRHCVRLIPNEGRSRIAWVLAKRLEQAEDRREDFFRNRVAPWIAGAWPRETESKDSSTTDHLIYMASNCGAAFPEAVELLLQNNLVGVIDGRGLATHRMQELMSELPESSEPALRLVEAILPSPDTVVSDRLGWVAHEVRELLGRVPDSGRSSDAFEALQSWLDATGA